MQPEGLFCSELSCFQIQQLFFNFWKCGPFWESPQENVSHRKLYRQVRGERTPEQSPRRLQNRVPPRNPPSVCELLQQNLLVGLPLAHVEGFTSFHC